MVCATDDCFNDILGMSVKGYIMKYLYGVFLDDGKWVMLTNRRYAINLLKNCKMPGQVRRMGYNNESWDSPTFRVCSECIYTVTV